MSEKKGSGLLARYEQMLKEKGNYYFDADEWEEIAYQYELTDKSWVVDTSGKYFFECKKGSLFTRY